MESALLEQWPAISRLLDEALALDDDRRRAWLDALPGEHASLKPVLERLLARQATATGFLQDLPKYAQVDDDPVPQTLAGTIVGPYRLIKQVGRGGMGAVWLADRADSDLKLPVALKLPYVEAWAPQLQERFDRERRILAALNHPNIARLYEAGVTEQGQPYLALEYVEGEPLLDWCARRQLTARKRIELFLQVLRAVQYAHASLVIHRDLKPSNVIVTATGAVKLLDFGIAKLIDRTTQVTEQTELTQLHGRVMTLEYASPEQVRGEPLTTATDVYSLGVVLFELLTGSRPYRLKRGSHAELEEAILLSETARPSQAATAALAMSAATTLLKWRSALRGDLDTIVLKALEKDRAVRYSSVEAFAQDCERYLDGRPVLARRQSGAYRLRKFIARHRLGLSAATAVALALVAGTGVALWQARIAIEQSRLAAAEAREQAAVQSFLTSLFDRNTRLQPDAAKARNMTVRELLVEASERVQGAFAETPAVKIELFNTIARLLGDIDEHERAAELSRQAIALARENGLATSDAYVEALMMQTVASRLLGRAEEGLAARDESLRVLDARGDRTSLLRARASANTLAQLAPDPEREIALIEQAVALFETRYATDPAFFNALYYLGNFHRTGQAPAKAVGYFRRAISVFDQTGSRDYTSFGASHAFVGECEFNLGQVSAALANYEKGIGILARHAGDAALVTRFQRGNYAAHLYQAGRIADAHRLFAELSAGRPASDPTVVDFDNAVYEAAAFLDEGRPREAERLLEAFSASWVEFGRRYALNAERWVSQLALARALQGRSDAAREVLSALDQLPSSSFAGDLRSLPQHVADAAWIELAAGDAEAAWTLLQRAGAALAAEPESFSWELVHINIRAAEIAVQRGVPAMAVAHAERALKHLRAEAEHDSLPFLESYALKVYGDALLAAGRPREAIEQLDAAIKRMRPLHSDDSPWLLDAIVSLALARKQVQDLPRSSALAAEARAIARRHPSLAPYFRERLQRLGAR